MQSSSLMSILRAMQEIMLSLSPMKVWDKYEDSQMYKFKRQKKKKKDNYSLAKLFLMHMSLRFLLKKTQQNSKADKSS